MNANLMTKKIEMTQKEAKAAGRTVSEEFKTLRMLKELYPDFEVVVKAPSKRKGEYKGLTYAYMRAYITKHDDDKNSKMAEFKNLLAEDKQNEELVEAACYFEVREWFLNTFKEVAEFKETRKAEIKKIVKKVA